MWPEKPINSGLLVGWMNVDEGGGNENLAVPWFMDGYMDFGIAGALVYAVLLGAAFAVIRKLNGRVNGVDLTMFIFIANCPILIRGTLAVVYVMILFQLVFLFIYKKVFAQQVNPAPVRRRLGSRGPIVRQRRHPRSV
jgi:uncharacterized membrane-anchored protein YitT (DUF2179 family)